MFFSYDIIILTKTWLSSSILDSKLSFNGFQVFRLDRNYINSSHSRGGGILIAAKLSLNSSVVNIDTYNAEQLFVLFFASSNLLVGAVYLQPKTAIPVLDAHTSCIEQLKSSISPSLILLCGNYYLLHISWYKDH